jgi:hypothetical protein
LTSRLAHRYEKSFQIDCFTFYEPRRRVALYNNWFVEDEIATALIIAPHSASLGKRCSAAEGTTEEIERICNPRLYRPAEIRGPRWE